MTDIERLEEISKNWWQRMGHDESRETINDIRKNLIDAVKGLRKQMDEVEKNRGNTLTLEGAEHWIMWFADITDEELK